MILDQITNLEQYKKLLPVKEILDFVKKFENEKLENGRYELDGDNLFALVQRYEAKPLELIKPEAHLKYIDLQYVATGEEMMYCDYLDKCTLKEDKTPDKDVLIYEDKNFAVKYKLNNGMFAILFPNDVHAPGMTSENTSNVEKIVFKIKV